MKIQAITPPEWFARGSLYQVNPRTFSPAGTLQAVTEAVPAIAGMGFGTLYLCPIFEADTSEDLAGWSERQKKSETNNPKNPYRMNDYFAIDEEYGTAEDLRALVAACHAHGMRVMLDLVYLHIGPNAAILKTHPEFAQHHEDGDLRCTHWHFPYLNYEEPGLREYLWCNMVYYVAVLDVDGFRCDVGDGVPLDFWEEGRRRIRAVKPDAVLLNEGVKWNYLLTGFDACYYFDWHETLYRVLGGTTAVSDLKALEERYMAPAPAGAMPVRDLDNHDTVTDWPARAEAVAGHEGMELAQVINYLMPGIPMVYCGNELADETAVSMFANRFHPGRFAATDRAALVETSPAIRRVTVMTALNRLKKESDVLHTGTLVWLPAPEGIFAIRREREGKGITLYGNLTREPMTVDAPAGVPLLTNGYTETDGTLTLAPFGYVVKGE